MLNMSLSCDFSAKYEYLYIYIYMNWIEGKIGWYSTHPHHSLCVGRPYPLAPMNYLMHLMCVYNACFASYRILPKMQIFR